MMNFTEAAQSNYADLIESAGDVRPSVEAQNALVKVAEHLDFKVSAQDLWKSVIVDVAITQGLVPIPMSGDDHESDGMMLGFSSQIYALAGIDDDGGFLYREAFDILRRVASEYVGGLGIQSKTIH